VYVKYFVFEMPYQIHKKDDNHHHQQQQGLGCWPIQTPLKVNMLDFSLINPKNINSFNHRGLQYYKV
jgi:hypothetical protein